MMKHLLASDYKKMRWKNGLGYTLELARSAGDDLAHFEWRISMADVSASGAFSNFLGMQRILSVLEGAGLCLNIEGIVHQLNKGQSICFSGERNVFAELLNGPVRDFNLIYNPNLWQAQHVRLAAKSAQTRHISADLIFLFNASIEPQVLQINGKSCLLLHYESILLDRQEAVESILTISGIFKNLCIIELRK